MICFVSDVDVMVPYSVLELVDKEFFPARHSNSKSTAGELEGDRDSSPL